MSSLVLLTVFTLYLVTLVVIMLALAAFVVSLFRPAGIFDISVYAFSGYTLIVPVMGFGLFWK